MSALSILIPKSRSDRSLKGLKTTDILVSDVRLLQKRLREIDPELRKQLVRDAKAVGKKAQSIIKPAIPPTAPLSGMMKSQGSFGWNTQSYKGKPIPANTTQVRFRTSSGGQAKITSLVSVRVPAPMTVIADMAGRSGTYVGKGYKGSGYSRTYTDRWGNLRRHRLNGQGENLIEVLEARGGGRGSRFLWPAIEREIPALKAEVQKIINDYIVIVNRKFK
jgi:hypothetical protein